MVSLVPPVTKHPAILTGILYFKQYSTILDSQAADKRTGLDCPPPGIPQYAEAPPNIEARHIFSFFPPR